MTIYGKVVSVALIVCLVLGLLVLGGYVRDWRVEQREAAKPEIAEETAQSKRLAIQMESLMIAVKQLTEAQADAYATKYGRPDIRVIQGPPGAPGAAGKDGETKVLTEVQDKRPMPAGFDALTTVDKAGKVETTVVPRKVPFLGAPLKWRFYLEGGTEELTMEKWRAEAGVEFRALRLGWVEIQPKASVGYFPLVKQDDLAFPPTIEHDLRVFTGLRVTFERR